MLRAKRRGGKEVASASEDEERCTSSSESFPAVHNESIQEQRAEEENKENAENNEETKFMKQSARESPEREWSMNDPILILPSARLLQRTCIHPIALDELNSEHQELYLREFIPPNPMTEARDVWKPADTETYVDSYEHEQDEDNIWPIFGV